MSFKKIGPWIQHHSELRYENPWIRVEHHEVSNPNGNPGIYGKIHFKNFAIGIVPIDNDLNTWIVGQHRYPLDQWTWEIPEGGGALDKPILESAKRELLEECGIIAKDWLLIQHMQLSNSVSDELGYIFLARDLEFVRAIPEDCEQLEIKKIPFLALYQQVLNGEITDSLSVCGVLKAALILQKEGLFNPPLPG